MVRPLDDVRVLDLTSSLAGPACTQILAALGADVIKVERPGAGDEARDWGPTMFFAVNAGKRSVVLDLKTEAGREALLRLVEDADVLVQSLRPGAAERLGIGAEAVRGRNPRLVYCSIGAYGAVGPLRDLPGYDPLMQAFAGIVSVTGEPDRPGVRAGVSVVDYGTATWAALAILAALRTGEGATIDLSLYETALALVGYHLLAERPPGRHGTAFPTIVPYQSFATADGELMIAAANDRLFAALCRALELPDDPRFATNPLRVENRGELIPLLERRLREETSEAWLERLHAAGVPAAPVQDVAEVVAHEQTRALGILQELDGRTTVALPLSFDAERVTHRSPPPDLGEHTDDVLYGKPPAR